MVHPIGSPHRLEMVRPEANEMSRLVPTPRVAEVAVESSRSDQRIHKRERRARELSAL
jgi:hypothetical protein